MEGNLDLEVERSSARDMNRLELEKRGTPGGISTYPQGYVPPDRVGRPGHRGGAARKPLERTKRSPGNFPAPENLMILMIDG